ncbi:MFS transporter [Saccharopolyspora shandongensis]|uniref:MFS transporter n=1 Tax=Saccharopolyspora shandongensis TaxID=418495 RepID=UPI00340F370F
MLALLVIDRLGRRKLMLIGSIGYLVTLGLLTATYLSQGDDFSGTASLFVVVMVMLFVAAHAFGQGAVIWVFIAEIFPTSIRARGQAFGSLVHWGFAAIISWIFPLLADTVGGAMAFAFFFMCMVGQLVWVLLLMPETKGVPLEKLKAALGVQDGPEAPSDSGQPRPTPPPPRTTDLTEQGDLPSTCRPAGVHCAKCGVPAGQYCRNWTRGSWWVARFHRPRQDAADVDRVLAPVGIRRLSWAKGTGAFARDTRPTPTA